MTKHKQLSILNTSELMKLVVLATFGQKDNASYAAYTSASYAASAYASAASYASAYEVFKPLADKILLPNLIMFEKLKKECTQDVVV